MRAAVLYIDSKKENAVYKNKPVYHYDGVLLPFERVRATINGMETNAAIHLFRYPPLLEFARQRGQITTLAPAVRATPLSLTDSHIRIEDYLAEQISHMKNNPKFSRKIKLDTLYAKCLIKQPMQKSRARAAIKELLAYWRGDCGFIGKGSKTEGDYILIDL